MHTLKKIIVLTALFLLKIVLLTLLKFYNLRLLYIFLFFLKKKFFALSDNSIIDE